MSRERAAAIILLILFISLIIATAVQAHSNALGGTCLPPYSRVGKVDLARPGGLKPADFFGRHNVFSADRAHPNYSQKWEKPQKKGPEWETESVLNIIIGLGGIVHNLSTCILSHSQYGSFPKLRLNVATCFCAVSLRPNDKHAQVIVLPSMNDGN